MSHGQTILALGYLGLGVFAIGTVLVIDHACRAFSRWRDGQSG